MERICMCCPEENCPLDDETKKLNGCIFNLIIFENKDKMLFYNIPNKSIFKVTNDNLVSELTFCEAIREIDIIPTKAPEWKRFQILNLAKDLGFFGITA